MDLTTDNASSSNTKTTEITSVDPVFVLKNHTIITTTGMERKFHKAAVEGNIDAFEGMGEQIESILTPNKNTILHIHFTYNIKSVSETFVEKILRMCPALVLKTNVKDETILHIAARYGHHKIVKQLIDCANKFLPKDVNEVGAEKRLVRAVNDKQETALHEAARFGHSQVVDLLIKEEPNHSYFGKNINDETPLYIAVERQHWNVMDTILDSGITSPQYSGPNGRNAVHAAVLHGDTGKVSKLLERNLSAEKEADENGWVPLHLAAIRASSEVVELLLSEDRSTTAYMRDKKGRTALHFAALCGNASVMKKIIEYCPDCCELVDKKGYNTLHYFMMAEEYPISEVRQIMKDTPLLRNLCNEKDVDGNAPLHLLARQKDDHPILKSDFPGVDTMACNKYGQTALDVAVADVPPHLVSGNKLLVGLQKIGARLGGRVLDKQLRGKKQDKRHHLEQEKRYDSRVKEEEKQQKTNVQDDLSGVAATLSVVAILIATVTFTAGFTLPGGLIQDGEQKGSPILKYNAAFIAFVITDSLSFVLSLCAVLYLFFSSILTVEGVYESMLKKCVILTMVAMGFMIIAFGTGLYAVLGVSKGFGVVTLLIVLSFFFVFGIALWRFYLAIIVTALSSIKIEIVEPSYQPDHGLHKVRDIQLYHTL